MLVFPLANSMNDSEEERCGQPQQRQGTGGSHKCPCCVWWSCGLPKPLTMMHKAAVTQMHEARLHGFCVVMQSTSLADVRRVICFCVRQALSIGWMEVWPTEMCFEQKRGKHDSKITRQANHILFCMEARL